MRNPKRIRMGTARTLRGFNRFFGRKRTISGRQMQELADEGFREPNLKISVKKVIGKRRKYKARYWDSKPSEGMRLFQQKEARRLIFHHERDFPLNGKSLLAAFERHLSNILSREPQRKYERIEDFKEVQEKLDREIETAIENLKSPFQAYSESFSLQFQRAYLMFPDRTSFVKALIKMTQKNSKMRNRLEQLNKITENDVGKLELVKTIYLSILGHLYSEAVKAAERPEMKRKLWIIK